MPSPRPTLTTTCSDAAAGRRHRPAAASLQRVRSAAKTSTLSFEPRSTRSAAAQASGSVGGQDAAGGNRPRRPGPPRHLPGRPCCRRASACGPCVRRREATRRSRAQPDLFPPRPTGCCAQDAIGRAEPPLRSARPMAPPVPATLHRPPVHGRTQNGVKTADARRALIRLRKMRFSDEKTGRRYNSMRLAPQTAQKAFDNQRVAKVEVFPRPVHKRD